MADEMSLQEIATRLDELMTTVRSQGKAFTERFDGVDRRLLRIEAKLEGIETKADLALEAFSVLNDSMDRQFAAVLEKLEDRAAPLEAAQRSTARRVGRIESRRKRP
jgi:hypothetical protein